MQIDRGKFIEGLKRLQTNDYPEMNRRFADDILCQLLQELGYRDVVSEYKKAVWQ